MTMNSNILHSNNGIQCFQHQEAFSYFLMGLKKLGNSHKQIRKKILNLELYKWIEDNWDLV